MDRRGVFLYLLLALVASYIVHLVVFMAPGLYLLRLLLFFIPLVAAWVASAMSPGMEPLRLVILPLRGRAAVRAALLVPAVFCITYIVTTLLGITAPDWNVGELMVRLPSAAQLGLPARTTVLLPKLYFLAGFVVSVLLGPTLYALLMLPHELGWRVFLTNRLARFGWWPAQVLTGLFWGVAIAPIFIDDVHGGALIWANAYRTILLAVVFSLVLGEVWRRTRHAGVTAICAGCILCQATTIWGFMFPAEWAQLPWRGPFAAVSLIIWALVAVIPGFLTGKTSSPKPDDSAANQPGT